MSSIVGTDIKDILKAGLQFGHPTSKWNPKMAKFIFGSKDGIHVVDVVQTKQILDKAVELVTKLASEGQVIFVGTKRQASPIVMENAVSSGSHFVVSRWAGGLFTNFNTISKSIKRLNELEKFFSEGVSGRTKYEVSLMKSEWQRLSRLYQGVKQMTSLPKAMIVVDPKFEKVAVREAMKMGIPVIALTDTNTDPDLVTYAIPGNDDALGAISLVVNALSMAVKAGNKGEGIKHDLSEYSKVEVEILKNKVVAQPEGIVEEVEKVEAPIQKTRIKSA